MNSFGDCKRILNFNKTKCAHHIILRAILLLVFIFIYININTNINTTYIRLTIILKFIIIPYLIVNIIVFIRDFINMSKKPYYIEVYENGIAFDGFYCLYKELTCTKKTYPFGNTLILSTDLTVKQFNYYLTKEEIKYVMDSFDNAKDQYLCDMLDNKVTYLGNFVATIKPSKLKCFSQLIISAIIIICCFGTAYMFFHSFLFSPILIIIMILIYFYGFKIICYFAEFLELIILKKSIDLYEHGLVTNNFICVYKHLTVETTKNFMSNKLTLITDFQSITCSPYLKNKDYELILSNASFINTCNKKTIRSNEQVLSSLFNLAVVVVVYIVVFSIFYYSL